MSQLQVSPGKVGGEGGAQQPPRCLPQPTQIRSPRGILISPYVRAVGVHSAHLRRGGVRGGPFVVGVEGGAQHPRLPQPRRDGPVLCLHPWGLKPILKWGGGGEGAEPWGSPAALGCVGPPRARGSRESRSNVPHRGQWGGPQSYRGAQREAGRRDGIGGTPRWGFGVGGGGVGRDECETKARWRQLLTASSRD